MPSSASSLVLLLSLLFPAFGPGAAVAQQEARSVDRDASFVEPMRIGDPANLGDMQARFGEGPDVPLRDLPSAYAANRRSFEAGGPAQGPVGDVRATAYTATGPNILLRGGGGGGAKGGDGGGSGNIENVAAAGPTDGDRNLSRSIGRTIIFTVAAAFAIAVTLSLLLGFSTLAFVWLQERFQDFDRIRHSLPPHPGPLTDEITRFGTSFFSR